MSASLACKGPSCGSKPKFWELGSYFHLGSGTCTICVPFFAERYTSPVDGLNAIGFQLCAPPGEGEIMTGSAPAEPGTSMGRPVLGSSPVAPGVPATYGGPERNSPVARSST